MSRTLIPTPDIIVLFPLMLSIKILLQFPHSALFRDLLDSLDAIGIVGCDFGGAGGCWRLDRCWILGLVGRVEDLVEG